MILVVILYAVLALTFVVAKYTLAYSAPCFLIGIRMVLAGMVLCGFQYLWHRPLLRIEREDWWLFGKVALFHIYLAFVPEFLALQSMSATRVNILYATTPFITACLAYILHVERITLKKVVGILVGLVSVMPLILFIQHEPLDGFVWFAISGPEIFLFIAIISSAYGWFLVQELIKKGYSLVLINGIAMFGGGIAALITSYFLEPAAYGALWRLPFWGWLLLLILSANIITYNLYGWLCSRYSITFISSAGFLCPVFGGVFGWWLEGDGISWQYLVSFLGITAGLWLYYQDDRSFFKKQYCSFKKV